MQPRGNLFVFEGPDGVGKTTLAQALTDHLNAINCPCEYLAFPGRQLGSLGHHVYELHHDPQRFGITSMHPMSLQMMHIAAHIDAIEQVILPMLKSGRSIVLDRFWWSTWVYGVVSGIDRTPLKALLQVEQTYWKAVLPTVVFLIRSETPLREDEPIDLWNKLSVVYYELAREQEHNYVTEIIHNNQPVARVLDSIIAAIAQAKQTEDQSVPNKTILESSEQTQIPFNFHSEDSISQSQDFKPFIYAPLAPAQITEVFDTYWRFAAERQAIFFKRVSGTPPPWTDDPILATYKFTNAYRASDRVSQYLIKHVIYEGDQSPAEIFFRTILFKIFNNIETWKLLCNAFGIVTYAEYDFDAYDAVLSKALADGMTIFSAAYIMPSGSTSFGYTKKHRNCLKLLERMMLDDVPAQMTELRFMREAFELLRSYPMIGDFLAYQYVTDINYSELTSFSEMEFVVPGPGARDGIRKCFSHLGGLNEADIIRLMTERQEEEFARLDINFQSLWGRPLQLIDCQNLFCEVDKYARVAHPQIQGVSGRQRIKQRYQLTYQPLTYWYPPKWGLHPV